MGGGVTADQERYLTGLFRGVCHTLHNRGLYQQRRDGSIREVAWKRTLLFPDLGVVAFQVDTMRLPVKIERLVDPDVAHQIQTSLGGRRVVVTNSRGLAFGVALEPEEPKPKARLPRRAVLDLEARPQGAHLIPIGQGTEGPLWVSLLTAGHILVGGESGSGKSTWLNAMLVALLHYHSPGELRVAIADPKQVEFMAYRGIPHLFAPVATEVDEATALTARVLAELERRMALFARAGAKNLAAYNRRAYESLPLLLLVIDEVTDIALEAGLKSSFYQNLIRLVSKGRAFGLSVILATQNPKAEVLNTLIRGNLSTRIAFRVTTADHSKTILGLSGAQNLPRTIRGRLPFVLGPKDPGLARLAGAPVTLQGFYVADEEIAALTARLRSEPFQTLTGQERAMVRYACEELGGAFDHRRVAAGFDEASEWQVRKLAERWEREGLLAPAENTSQGRVPRQVTGELAALAAPEMERVG